MKKMKFDEIGGYLERKINSEIGHTTRRKKKKWTDLKTFSKQHYKEVVSENETGLMNTIKDDSITQDRSIYIITNISSNFNLGKFVWQIETLNLPNTFSQI